MYYKLIDLSNDDAVVYSGDSTIELMDAYFDYDNDCEDDWQPLLIRDGKPVNYWEVIRFM